MKHHLRIFSILLFFLLLFYGNLYSQKYTAGDSTFEAYMDDAWDEIRQSDFSDSVQNVYADEFYTYYLNNPDSKTGERAISQAFMMWGNTGAAEKTDEAMSHVDYNSGIWSKFIQYVSNSYYKSEQRTQQDYINLLQKLDDKLSHPKSRSAVLWMLSKHYHSDNKPEKVKKITREIIELNAVEFHVEQARGLLYEIESLSVGQKAPNFRVQTVKGDSIALSDYRGKIVLLDFWATWCGPCLPEIPHLKSIQANHSEKELQIIGIALEDDPGKLIKFLTEKQMNWPHVLQSGRWNDELSELYNITGIPQTYIIDRNGTIAAKELRKKELEKEIAKLIAK